MHAQPSDDGVRPTTGQRGGPGQRDHGRPGDTDRPDAMPPDAQARDPQARDAAFDVAQEAVLDAELAVLDDRREIPAEDDDARDWPDPDCGPPEELVCVPSAATLASPLGDSPLSTSALGAKRRQERVPDRRPGVIPAGFLPRDGSGLGTGFADGGPLDVLAPGPVLAALADRAHDDGLGELDDDALIGVLRAWRRQASWAAARELSAVAELARRRPADRCTTVAADGFPAQLSEFVSDEVAAALTLTGRAAGDVLGLALTLAARLPGTAAALEAGDLDLPRAKVIADGTGGLDDAHAAAVEVQVLPDAPSMTTGQLRAAVARAVLAADPAAARRRREQAEKNARVERWDEDAGTAALAGRDLPPADVLAADKRLCQIARAWKQQGAGARMDILRARVYVALLLGRPVDHPPADLLPPGTTTPGGASTGGAPTGGAPDSPPAGPLPIGAEPPGAVPGSPLPGSDAPGAGLPGLTGSVNLIIPWATLLGLSDGPGEVDGYGPVDGQTARALAGTATGPAARWHVTFTGADGQAIAHGCATRGAAAADGSWTVTITASPLERGTCTHRRESAGYQLTLRLRHLIEIRNRTCTFPGCRHPAARCDMDHTVAYDRGGRSCECNIAPLCRRHHRLKQAHGWKLEQTSPGVLTWTTPAGRRYTISPEGYPLL